MNEVNDGLKENNNSLLESLNKLGEKAKQEVALKLGNKIEEEVDMI